MTNRVVLCAPDSFKESLSAHDVAQAMASGVRACNENAIVDVCPIADGGEGTVATMQAAMSGEARTVRVTGPLGDPVESTWCIVNSQLSGGERCAVIEMASAAGLHLVPPSQRDPTRTTTRGVGELIRHAVDAHCNHIILGIGGSATCDGGAGLAQALGVRFTMDDGSVRDEAMPPMTGGDLARVSHVERDSRIPLPPITVACDVTNPLTGPNGAASVFGPQKGATAQQVRQLDDALAHFATRLPDADPLSPGAGAAGGLGFGLMAMCDATLRSGVELIFDAVNFEQRVRRASVILTGEGRLDSQSMSGKVIDGVVQMARACNVPVIAIVGTIDPELDLDQTGLHAAYAINTIAQSTDDAMSNAAMYVQRLVERALSSI